MITGNQFSAAMSLAGVSFKVLEYKTGISQNTMKSWRRNRAKPIAAKQENLEKVKDVLYRQHKVVFLPNGVTLV
jgi:hypothetical protein